MVRGPSGRHALPMNSTTTPPAPEPPVRRLHRSKTDRVIGGVAGVLLYLAALLLVPNDGEEAHAPGRALTIVGVVLIAIAVGGLFSANDGGWFFVPVVLVGVAGIFAWQ